MGFGRHKATVFTGKEHRCALYIVLGPKQAT